jgi:hypothetical protein
LWRSAGQVHILLGNLETGLTGDARTERLVTLILQRRELGLSAGDYELREAGGSVIQPESSSPDRIGFVIRLAPESSAVFTLAPRTRA